MEKLNINKILNREENENSIKSILKDFEANANNLLFKKGIYIYGNPGTGKTTFIVNILKELNYDNDSLTLNNISKSILNKT